MFLKVYNGAVLGQYLKTLLKTIKFHMVYLSKNGY